MALSRDQGTRTDKMRKGKNMSNEEKCDMPQSGLWSSSEMAEHWQQDVERRRQDFAEATQRMLEAARLKPGDHVLDIAAGTGDQSLLAARRVGPGGSILATDISAATQGIAPRVVQQEAQTNLTTRRRGAQQRGLA